MNFLPYYIAFFCLFGLEAVTSQTVNYAILGGSYFGPNRPYFTSVAEATQYGKVFFKNIDAVYNAYDWFFTEINTLGGIPLHDANNTHVLTNYTIINIDWYKLRTNPNAIVSLAYELSNPNGIFGKIHFVIQLLTPSVMVPVFSEACINNCVVINNVPSVDSYYVCDNTMPDCIASHKREGFRRFSNTLTVYTDTSLLTEGMLTYWFNAGIKTVIIVTATDALDMGAYTQTLNIVQELQMIVLDTIIFPIPTNNVSTKEFYPKVEQWIKLNPDGIIFLGEDATGLPLNYTGSIQNLIYAMKDYNFMPKVVALDMATLDYFDPWSVEYMWVAAPWSQVLRGLDFRPKNTSTQLELFPATATLDSPRVFFNALIKKWPQYQYITTASLTAALSMASCIVTQKLIEFSGSIEYSEILDASQIMSEASMFGKLQFDAFGRLVTINNDQLSAQLLVNATINQTYAKIITPILSGGPPILPTPNWSERTYINTAYTSVAESVIIVVNSVILFFIACMFVHLLYHWNHHVLKTSSPIFLCYFFLGATLMIISNYAGSTDPTNDLCATQIWTLSLGFNLLFGSLFLKTWRLWRIFFTRGLRVITITNSNLSLKLLLFVGIDIVLNIIWTTVSGMDAEYIVVDIYRPSNNYHFCGVGSYERVFLLISVVLKFFYVFLAVVMAWYTRELDTDYNEGLYVSLSIYSTLLVGVLFVSIIGSGILTTLATYIIINIGVMLMVLSCVCFMYVSKVFAVYANLKGEASKTVVSGRVIPISLIQTDSNQ